jgi:hypothetical protein
MADQAQPQAGDAPTTPGIDPASIPAASKPMPQADDMSALPTWAQTLVSDLRKENASHRTAKTAAERQAQQATEQAAKDQGKWKELAEGYEPKAKRVDLVESYIADMLAAELKIIPERLRALVPAFDDPLKTLQWVQTAKASGVLAAPSAPQTDAGEANGTNIAAGNAVKDREVWARLGFNNALRSQAAVR